MEKRKLGELGCWWCLRCFVIYTLKHDPSLDALMRMLMAVKIYGLERVLRHCGAVGIYAI